MSERTCRCGRPTGDAFVCQECGDDLARALGDVTWLADELDTTIARQKGIDYRNVGGSSGGKKATERPSPVSWGASEARTDLKAVLVSWALYCAAESVRSSDPHDGLPADDLPALSRFLLWRVDGLALLEIGLEAVDEITREVDRCRRVIDRPADRKELGKCAEDECAGIMYVRDGRDMAECDVCGVKQSAAELTDALLAELDDRLCTAAEIAQLSTYLGLKADRTQVRKHVEYLARNRRIVAHPSFSDVATYRFGDVYEHLIRRDYGTRKASA
jgi:hypothetical protein